MILTLIILKYFFGLQASYPHNRRPQLRLQGRLRGPRLVPWQISRFGIAAPLKVQVPKKDGKRMVVEGPKSLYMGMAVGT